MSSSIYEGELFERAVSANNLSARIIINEKYSSTNFNDWLLLRLNVEKGYHILDVGCGNGAQTIPFWLAVGEKGSVSALDISAESVRILREKTKDATNLQVTVADMGNLKQVIEEQFRVQRYDLAHSAYSLYYSSNPQNVLDSMRNSLNGEGKLAIFTPNEPHGMVNFVKQFTSVPKQVDDCLVFGPRFLEPYFRRHFWDVSISFFHNVIKLRNVEDFINFYRVTTYYDRRVEKELAEEVQQHITEQGYFEYEKNGYLIIGQHQFPS